LDHPGRDALRECGVPAAHLGLCGFPVDDSFKFGSAPPGHRYFGATDPGVTPVVAAYSGYLTRRPDWKSTLAIRIPSDPLQPGRQIWLYYTHMAMPDGRDLIDAAFPPGTAEAYVEAGALIRFTRATSPAILGNPHRRAPAFLDCARRWKWIPAQ